MILAILGTVFIISAVIIGLRILLHEVLPISKKKGKLQTYTMLHLTILTIVGVSLIGIDPIGAKIIVNWFLNIWFIKRLLSLPWIGGV